MKTLHSQTHITQLAGSPFLEQRHTLETLQRKRRNHIAMSMNPKVEIPGVAGGSDGTSWLYRSDLLSTIHYIHSEVRDRTFTGTKHLAPIWLMAIMIPLIAGSTTALLYALAVAAVMTTAGFLSRSFLKLSSPGLIRLNEIAQQHAEFASALRFARGDDPDITLAAANKLVSTLRAARG